MIICITYSIIVQCIEVDVSRPGFLFGRSELNLGVDRSGFTLVRFCKENPELDLLVKVSDLPSPPSVIFSRADVIVLSLHVFFLDITKASIGCLRLSPL